LVPVKAKASAGVWALGGVALGLPPDGLISFFVENGEDEDGDYLGTGHVQLDRKIPKSGVWRLPTPKRVKESAWFELRFEPRLTLPCVGTSVRERHRHLTRRAHGVRLGVDGAAPLRVRAR
jgi:hypothetical protein